MAWFNSGKDEEDGFEVSSLGDKTERVVVAVALKEMEYGKNRSGIRGK